MPSDASARTVAQPKKVPIARPRVAPKIEIVTASQRMVAPTCPRTMPTARSSPSSRVRSVIDSAMVLAMPSTAIRIASASMA